MKKLFSLLTLALLTMSAWAANTVEIDFSAQNYANAEDLTTLTVDGVTLTFDQGTGTNAPKYYTSGTNARIYTGNTLKVAASEAITKIVFTCSNNYYWGNQDTWSTGSYSDGTWTGSAQEITFTRVTSGQTRIQKMEITLGGEVVETVLDPVFTPGDGTSFVDSQEITLTCGTADATISYSTNGLTWETYTEPFTINETTTVYAKAAKNSIESNVVSATYTKLEPVSGTCITFNYADDESFEDAKEYTVSRPGASFTVSNGVIKGHYRIYKNHTIAFTSTAGNIVRIEFDCTANGTSQYGPGCLTVNDNNGNYSYEGKLGTWIGSAENVTFTASTNQVRCTEIRVYVDGELPAVTVAAPTLPASQEFEESLSVEIINNEEDATLMYALNDGEFTEYTQALNITETTTVHAKAVKGEYESTTVSATYTKVEPAQAIMTLAEVSQMGNVDFTFGGNAVVTAQQGAYLWLRDATGYGLIYGQINGQENLEFNNGEVLNPNWTATKTVYNGLPEFKNAANVSKSENTDTELAKPQEITELNENLINAYVVVKNITSFTVDGRNVTANLSDGSTMVMYNQFNTVITNIPTEEGDYTVTGAVGRYTKGQTDQIQLYILNIEGAETPEPVVVDVNNFNEAYALDNNTKINMYNDVVVTYQKGNRLWVRDTEGTSGLIYGALGEDATFENGDVLSDGWSAIFQLFNEITPEFINPEGIQASGDTRDASPFERTNITTGNVNEYVILKGLTLLTDTTNNKRFYNAADSLVLFNNFNVTLPAIEEGKTYDVTGIVTIYYGEAQIYITEMTEVASDVLRGDVDNSGDVKIGDVTALINYLLSGDATSVNLANADCDNSGDVKIGDVTALINYLLSSVWAN